MGSEQKLQAFHEAALNIFELEDQLHGRAHDDGKEIAEYTLSEVIEEARYIRENRLYLEPREKAQLTRFIKKFDPSKKEEKPKLSDFVINFKENYESLIIHQVKSCVKELMKKKYELNMNREAVTEAVKSIVIHQGTHTCGGTNIIKIGATTMQDFTGFTHFNEYASFNNDSEIGRIEYGTFEALLFLVVAHEVSHHIQHRYLPKVARFKGKHRKPHGDGFKWVYRQLRRELVNPFVHECNKKPGHTG